MLANSGGFTPHDAFTRAFCRIKGTEAVTRLVAGAFARFYLKRRTPTVERMIERARASSRSADSIAVEAAVWRSFTSAEHDLRERARHVHVPTLIVWGGRDPNLPLHRDGRAIRAALPHARFEVLETGHAPFAEAPEDFLALAVPFLHAVAGGGGQREIAHSTR